MDEFSSFLMLFAIYLPLALAPLALIWGLLWALKKVGLDLLRTTGIWPWAILLGGGLAPAFIATGHSALVMPLGLHLALPGTDPMEHPLLTIIGAPLVMLLVFKSLRLLGGAKA